MDSHQNNNNNNNNILMDFLCKTFFSLSFFVYVELFWFPTKKKKKEEKSPSLFGSLRSLHERLVS